MLVSASKQPKSVGQKVSETWRIFTALKGLRSKKGQDHWAPEGQTVQCWTGRRQTLSSWCQSEVQVWWPNLHINGWGLMRLWIRYLNVVVFPRSPLTGRMKNLGKAHCLFLSLLTSGLIVLSLSTTERRKIFHFHVFRSTAQFTWRSRPPETAAWGNKLPIWGWPQGWRDVFFIYRQKVMRERRKTQRASN